MQVTENKGIFTYRQSPILHRSWMIYLKPHEGEMTAVGDYTVIDRSEKESLSEKKVMNLMTLLNGGSELIELGDITQSQLLFHRKPKADKLDPTQVVFYTQTGDGVSRENAILTLEAGVIDVH